MHKLIEAHKLIAQGHALLAEHHAEVGGDTTAPATKKGKKATEPVAPVVTSIPETTTPVVTIPPVETTAPAITRDGVKDKFVEFAKASADNTAKAKQLLAQYGVAKYSDLPDDKLPAFLKSLEAIASPAASDSLI